VPNESTFSRLFPGKDTVGIELGQYAQGTVKLRELFQSTDWDTAKEHAKIPLALGKDVYGKTIIADLAQMPHCLSLGRLAAEERLYQCADCQHALSLHAGRDALGYH
jgi:DNA segregation ATPase FtsK/SpoIIIE and related proteins